MLDRPRIILSLPDSAESTAVADWLAADGLEPVRRPTTQAAADEMLRPFAMLITDVRHRRLLLHCRTRNAFTPAILIGDKASAAPGDVVGAHTTYLSRPIDRAVFKCFVDMAMLDTRPARRSVRKPVNRFDAIVNGVPTHIVDVSAEGLRLELSADRRAALPPYFTVRVPIAGVAVTVQRMWTQSSSRGASIWYGGALSKNRASIDLAWRAFVENLPSMGNAELLINP